jgi:hypothetical protein
MRGFLAAQAFKVFWWVELGVFKFDIDADNDARDSPFAADKSAGGPHRRE